MNRLIYSDVTDLVWITPDHSMFACKITFVDHPILGTSTHAFATSINDLDPHSVEIFEMGVSGQLGKIADYVEPAPVVPYVITPAQAKITLYEAGLLDIVENLILSYPYRPVTIWWGNASQFERGNPYLQALGYELNLTDGQMDELFITAGKK